MTEALNDLAGWAQALVGPGLDVREVSLGQMAARAALVYLAVLLLVRVGSKRFLSKATPFDAVVAIMLGSIMSSAITGSTPFWTTVAAGASIMAAHSLIAFLTARTALGSLFKGEPRLLIKDGEVQEEELRRAKLSKHDLEAALREQGHDSDPSKIERAYLERSGAVSIVAAARKPRIVESSVADGVQTIRIELAA